MIKLPRKRSLASPRRKDQALLSFAHADDIRSLFELLGMVAHSKEWGSSPDIMVIDRFITAHLPSSDRDFAISCFLKGKSVSQMQEAVTKRAFQLYGFRDYGEPERWLEPLQVLDILLRVALANGKFGIIERHLIDYTRQTLGVHSRAYWVLRDTIANKLGVYIPREGPSFNQEDGEPATNTKSQQKPSVKTSISREESLKRLGLNEDASAAEIKVQYRTLVKQCHPDLVTSKGDDQALRAAALRFCELQEAYELLTT